MKRPNPTFIELGDKAPDQKEVGDPAAQPAAEDDLGGGDICSIEETPSTDDDQPLS